MKTKWNTFFGFSFGAPLSVPLHPFSFDRFAPDKNNYIMKKVEFQLLVFSLKIRNFQNIKDVLNNCSLLEKKMGIFN